MTTPNYNPAMVTLARESRGLTQTQLAEKMAVPQGTVSKLESGALTLNPAIVATLSRCLNYPELFFLQADQVYPFGSSTFYHRRLQSVPVGVLRRIEATVNIYRAHISRLLRATDLDSRCQFRRFDANEFGGRIEEIAQLTRSVWRIPPGPAPDLIKTIEDAGGIVVRFDFGTKQMFGISEWIPPYPPLFFLNDNPEITADRDRFTLAHELGHVLLHALPNPKMEEEADRFAAEFLMPERDIRPHLIAPIKLHSVAKLKPYWKVAMAALIRRSRDLSIINENQYTYLRIQIQQRGYRLREPRELDIKREHPTLLREIIRAHTQELGFAISEVSAMVSMGVEEFRAFHGLNDTPSGLKIIRRA